MDLTIPYTFYPIALPHWMAWTLFLIAVLGAVIIGTVVTAGRGWFRGVLAGVFSTVVLLAATMMASMVITFFVHDQ